MLSREHLDRTNGDDHDLVEPQAAFEAFATTAANLDHWYTSGRVGPRPPGRLRRYHTPTLSSFTRAWATPLYRVIYDPDGRPHSMRRRGQF